MKKNFLVYGLCALAFAGLGAYFSHVRTAPVAAESTATSQLLSQTLPDPQGQSQSLAKWQGKTLIVNFWAPWCPPCVKEMPELSELHASLAARDIHVIGIGIDTQAHIAEFAGKHKIDFPLYVAGMGGTELARKLGNQSDGLPFTALIGADGKVRKTYLGSLKFDQLKADLDSL